MIYQYNINGEKMLFSWDEEKNRSNIKKHHISFETALHVFEDKNYIELHDCFHGYEEDRFIVIGMAEDILFVVLTERGEVNRIISARIANKRERDLYYGQHNPY